MSQIQTVLVVDDDDTTLRAIGALCGDRYEMLMAADARRAIELVQQRRPQVVISDLWLPEEDGVSLLTEVQKFDPDVVRVLMTGHGELNAVIDAINRAKVYLYLRKPFSRAQLLDTIDQATVAYHHSKQNRTDMEQILRTVKGQLSQMQSVLDDLYSKR